MARRILKVAHHTSPKPLDWRVNKRLLDIQTNERVGRMDVGIFDRATEALIVEKVGFSPLVNTKTGAHYPDRRFRPFWTVYDHMGFFELRASFGHRRDLTCVLLIADDENTEPMLRRAFHDFAVPMPAMPSSLANPLWRPGNWETGILARSPENDRDN